MKTYDTTQKRSTASLYGQNAIQLIHKSLDNNSLQFNQLADLDLHLKHKNVI